MVNKLVLTINILALICSITFIVIGFMTNDIFEILNGSFLTIINIIDILFTSKISNKDK